MLVVLALVPYRQHGQDKGIPCGEPECGPSASMLQVWSSLRWKALGQSTRSRYSIVAVISTSQRRILTLHPPLAPLLGYFLVSRGLVRHHLSCNS